MTETYTNDIADVVALYPGAAYTARQILNRANDYLEVTENITVPASADDDGLYRVELNHGILQTATLTITVDSAVLTPIQYGQSPAAGEVGVNYAGVPVLQFHASLAGLTGTAVYTPLGTVISSGILNRLQAEVVAIETALVAGPPHSQNTDTGTTSATWTINSGASGVGSEARMTLKTADSDAIVVNYSILASHNLPNVGASGVGVFSDAAYSNFAAGTFYGSGAGLSALPITGMPPGGSWPTLTSDLIVGRITIGKGTQTGDDVNGVALAAPTAGTNNRYTLYLAAPTGGAVSNHSLYAAGSIASAGTVSAAGWGGTGVLGIVNGGTGSNGGTTFPNSVVYLDSNGLQYLGTYNLDTTRKFLRQVGDGADAEAPAFDTLAIGDMPPGGSWPTLTSDLVVGPLTVNYAADGADYKSVEIAAPTSGTNRYTLDLAAPSGGTINGSLRSQGYLYLGTGSKCMYESTSYWYFNNCNSYRFYGSNRGIHLDVTSGGCKILGSNYSGDSVGFTIQSQSETLTLATLANNKNIILTPHGTGVVSVSAAQVSGTNANGLTIAVTTASKPLTLTPGSGAKVETAAQMKAAGFEAGAAAGVASGSFVDADGNTLTITGGIITAITPP